MLWCLCFFASVHSITISVAWLSDLVQKVRNELIAGRFRLAYGCIFVVLRSKFWIFLFNDFDYIFPLLNTFLLTKVFVFVSLRLIWSTSQTLNLLHPLLFLLKDLCPVSGNTVRHRGVCHTLVHSILMSVRICPWHWLLSETLSIDFASHLYRLLGWGLTGIVFWWLQNSGCRSFLSAPIRVCSIHEAIGLLGKEGKYLLFWEVIVFVGGFATHDKARVGGVKGVILVYDRLVRNAYVCQTTAHYIFTSLPRRVLILCNYHTCRSLWLNVVLWVFWLQLPLWIG